MVDFTTLLNKYRDLVKTKTDVVALYTHYYLVNSSFQLTNNKEVSNIDFQIEEFYLSLKKLLMN